MAIKTFTAGSILTASDTNTYLANAGLDFVKSQTVGTGVSSVTVTNAFSSTWDAYRIIYDGGSASTDISLGLKIGNATSGYYWAILFNQYNSGTPNGAASTTGTSFPDAGRASTNGNNLIVDVFSPYLSRRTTVRFESADYFTTGFSIVGGGMLNNTNSYTEFTISPTSGTLTGGTIIVYGYRKA